MRPNRGYLSLNLCSPRLLQSSFRRVRRILSLFTYALDVSAEAVNRVASCGRAQKD